MRKAMILAAGYGKRMRELTRALPKPLMPVAGRPLIVHMVEHLARSGFHEIIINVSYLANLLETALGDGHRYGAKITFSHEAEPLEWGGGVLQALPLLGNEPFLVTSGDLWTNYPFDRLRTMSLNRKAHLILIKESSLHPDFNLTDDFSVTTESPVHTYGGMGLFHPDLFSNFKPGKHSFCDVIMPAIKNAQVSGEIFDGSWFNVGTPECLNGLCKWLEDAKDNSKAGVLPEGFPAQ